MGDVATISSTIQEFNGERYYLCGNYFQHKGKRLHRAVWEAYNGDIPEGYHVHHIDEDRHNNSIDNLALMPGVEHMKEHRDVRVKNGKVNILKAIAEAPKWHHSEEGKKWHSKQGKHIWEMRKPIERTCTLCGKVYFSTELSKTGNHFCSNKCKAKYRRQSGVDNETRVCVYCGKEYQANKYSKQKCCSRECARANRWKSKA